MSVPFCTLGEKINLSRSSIGTGCRSYISSSSNLNGAILSHFSCRITVINLFVRSVKFSGSSHDKSMKIAHLFRVTLQSNPTSHELYHRPPPPSPLSTLSKKRKKERRHIRDLKLSGIGIWRFIMSYTPYNIPSY